MQRDSVNDPKLCIILLQATAAIVVILSVIVIKALGGNLYSDLKEWFSLNFLNPTSVSQVTQNDDTDTQTQDNLNSGENVVLTNAVALNNIANIKNLKADFKNGLVIPLKNGIITSRYGERDDPFSSSSANHYGLDIAANGTKDIVCAADGTVSFVGYEEDGYGNYFTVNHTNGFKTLYAHCSSVLINKGDTVKAGQVVAKVGNTGKTTGVHLHFEILINETRLNPEWFLDMDELQ